VSTKRICCTYRILCVVLCVNALSSSSFRLWYHGLPDQCIEFDGNLSTRQAFLKNIPDEQEFALMKQILNQRTLLDEWRRQRGVNIEDSTKEVGSLLTHLASWHDGVDIERRA
jgi:hypothetical protein